MIMLLHSHRAVFVAAVAAAVVLAVITGAESGRGAGEGKYDVRAQRIFFTPIISRQSGAGFPFVYNAALLQTRAAAEQDSLAPGVEALVRCQNSTTPPYGVSPSFMALANISLLTGNASSQPTAQHVVFEPAADYEKCGTEDPRVVRRDDGVYFLFYTAYDCKSANLALATTRTPADKQSWARHGIILPNRKWSKSGAAILSSPSSKSGSGSASNYLIWGDSTLDKGLHVATSPDGIHNWTTQSSLILPVRSAAEKYFDSYLVEAGPPPLPLLSNTQSLPHTATAAEASSASPPLFFLYNSARAGFPSPKPGYDLQYNIGFAILDGNDPLTVLQRSDTPLLSPDLFWEIGNTTDYLTPNVVFVEGMVPSVQPLTSLTCSDSRTHPVEAGRFYFVYGAADTSLGAAEAIICAAPA